MSIQLPDLPGLRRRTCPEVSPAPTPEPAGASQRLHALDALRAAAMLLGVVLHAAIAYMPHRMPHLLWAVHDTGAKPAFDLIFWWIHGFRLPLFFLLAGFFSAMIYQARGPREFLANRTRRVLMPLLAASVLLLPVTYLIWSAGWLVSGLCSTSQFLRIKYGPELAEHLYGLGHLWFLEHLFLISAGYWALRTLAARYGAGESPSAISSKVGLREDGPHSARRSGKARRWSPLLYGLIGVGIVWLAPGAVHHFNNTFVPDPARLLYYCVFFAAGTSLFPHRERLFEITRHWALCLLVATAVFAANAALLMQHLQGHATTLVAQLPLAVATVAYAWLSAIGWLGLFLRAVRGSSSWVRYLADASYWIYLFHMPVVGLVQVLLYPVSLPAWIKFLAAVAAGAGLGFLTYQGWVRYTFLGRALNGPRERPTPIPPWRSTSYWAVPLCASALLAIGFAWPARAFLWEQNLHSVIAGEVYRSGAPKPPRLAALIEQLELRTVISVQGGTLEHGWFAKELAVCNQHDVVLHAVDFKDDWLPSRSALMQLCDLLETSPRPLLLHGRFGIQRTGIAAAVAELQHGMTPEVALRQFDRQTFCNWDHTAYRGTKLLLAYADWLAAQNTPHTFAAFRHWAATQYDADQIVARNDLVYEPELALRASSDEIKPSELLSKRPN